jgi:hypothetical protein
VLLSSSPLRTMRKRAGGLEKDMYGTNLSRRKCIAVLQFIRLRSP